jgi:hypothetical protein
MDVKDRKWSYRYRKLETPAWPLLLSVFCVAETDGDDNEVDAMICRDRMT